MNMFGQLARVWKISKIFHEWSLIGWPASDSWSGNLLVYEKYLGFFMNCLYLDYQLVVRNQITCLWCEKYLVFFTDDLRSGDQPFIRDQVTCQWCEKYLEFFTDCLCLSDQPVVCDRVTCSWCENIQGFSHIVFVWATNLWFVIR